MKKGRSISSQVGDGRGAGRSTQLSPRARSDEALISAVRYHQEGQLARAEELYRKILAADPDNANCLHLLGVIAHQMGRHEAAIDLIDKAISRDSGTPEFHYNIGLPLQAIGRLEAAIAHYRRAAALRPDYAAAHMNVGNALREFGNLDEAAVAYERVVALRPDHADGWNNLGVVRATQGKSEIAGVCYRRALASRPNHFEAHVNLGRLLYGAGDTAQALNVVGRAFGIKETEELRALLVRCIRALDPAAGDEQLRAVVTRALIEPWGRPTELATISAKLIKLDSRIAQYITRAVDAWPRRLPAQELLGDDEFEVLCEDQLLRGLLETTPVCDVELERFLTGLRFALLEIVVTATAPEIDNNLLGLCSALAQQCFINEYVFVSSDREFDQAVELRDRLVFAVRSNAVVPAAWLAIVAAYFPLMSLPEADKLRSGSWPDAVNRLLVRQVAEPLQERDLQQSMPRLSTIDDEVSRAVRGQYEANPYPRWIKTAPVSRPETINRYLRNAFPLTFVNLEERDGVDILVAGCGTGRQSIEVAQRFAGARVLAIDLSLASLGYAKRKTKELGLTSIEYAQGDILNLGSVGRTFDMIETIGVLHHLADPVAGWRVLLSLLRPGGVMRVGLYSELGRPDVVAGRALIAERRYGSSADDIRQFRQELMVDHPALAKDLVRRLDFFTVSECRDLLFHVQEHRLTIPQIEEFAEAHSLRFLGFEVDYRVREQYRRRFPKDVALTDLKLWHAFETESPNIFDATYQFWLQYPR